MSKLDEVKDYCNDVLIAYLPVINELGEPLTNCLAIVGLGDESELFDRLEVFKTEIQVNAKRKLFRSDMDGGKMILLSEPDINTNVKDYAKSDDLSFWIGDVMYCPGILVQC